MKTFLQDFIEGSACANEIDDYIGQWHESLEDGVRLHEFLGISEEAYKKWVECPDDVHDIFEFEFHRQQAGMHGLISPTCCDDMIKNNTVIIYIEEYDWKNDCGNIEFKPIWVSYNLYKDPRGFPAKSFTSIPVKFCPHCAKPLPKIVNKLNPPKKTRLNGDGNYCGTCDERLCMCSCLDPVYLYKIEGEEG